MWSIRHGHAAVLAGIDVAAQPVSVRCGSTVHYSRYSRPEALLERAWPPRGRLRQHRLVRAHAFACSRCQRRKVSRLVAEVDGDPARRLCNACYSRALAVDPAGSTIPA